MLDILRGWQLTTRKQLVKHISITHYPLSDGTDSSLGFLGPAEITSFLVPKSEIVLSSDKKSTILSSFSPFASWASFKSIADSCAAKGSAKGSSGFFTLHGEASLKSPYCYFVLFPAIRACSSVCRMLLRLA